MQIRTTGKPDARNPNDTAFRKSGQRVAPCIRTDEADTSYDLYPAFAVPSEAVNYGFDAMARLLGCHSAVRIDGFVGVLWDELKEGLGQALLRINVVATWIDIAVAYKSPSQIESVVEPFLGGNDPLFGKRCNSDLIDFLDAGRLNALSRDHHATVTFLYGCGAALVDWEGPLVYVDLPKNELQYRSRAGTILNLGAEKAGTPKEQYKRFYFVDWPVLNRHKANFVNQIDWFVDGQRPDEPTFTSGPIVRDALNRMSSNVFRARPWFEAGPWGGQWLKQRIDKLPQEEPNYAWSFELISPENGISLCDGCHQIELSFDWLMFHNSTEVLGEFATQFKFDFPIRFDFLDTFDGGNLSVQCHPRQDYIQKHFGESFTQDETYYILDCKDGAEVYLGFREGIDPDEFRSVLEQSYQDSTVVEIKNFVNTVPARKHDLLLIPNGTIHCSGADILVLEISATPYIFTFKMYDWLRLGLDGAPRPLNIDRAFENLDFKLQGDEARCQLISRPSVIASSHDWQIVHLPTHKKHFYDVHRYEFATEIVAETQGSPHVLMVVEGSSVMVETKNGTTERYNFIETFVVPAAAGSYKLVNLGKTPVKVIKAFIKATDL